MIIGCYKRCPTKVSGESIPVTELGDDNTEIDIDVVLDLDRKFLIFLVLISLQVCSGHKSKME